MRKKTCYYWKFCKFSFAFVEAIRSLHSELQKQKVTLEERESDWQNRFTSTFTLMQKEYEQKFQKAVDYLSHKFDDKKVEELLQEQKTRLQKNFKEMAALKSETEATKASNEQILAKMRKLREQKDLAETQLETAQTMLAKTKVPIIISFNFLLKVHHLGYLRELLVADPSAYCHVCVDMFYNI